MADKSKDKNFFQKIGQVFKEVRQELRKSTWPSKEKLKNTSAVVLAVIAFFAVFLSFISLGGRWVLDKINFYDEVEPTATAEPEIPWDGAYMEKEDFLAYTAHDLESIFEAIEDQLDDAQYQTVKTVVDNGIDAINASTSVKDAEKAYEDAYNGIINAIPKADGLVTYKKENNADRAESDS